MEISKVKEDVKVRLKAFPSLTGLSSISDETLDIFAEDAVNQAYDDHFTDRNVALAASLLCAHFITVATADDSNVAKETVDVISREYFDRGGSDDYLTEYRRLQGSPTIRFM